MGGKEERKEGANLIQCWSGASLWIFDSSRRIYLNFVYCTRIRADENVVTSWSSTPPTPPLTPPFTPASIHDAALRSGGRYCTPSSILFLTIHCYRYMESFIPIKLSESQRPVFLEGELEVIIQDNVAIYDGYEITSHAHYAPLTWHP